MIYMVPWGGEFEYAKYKNVDAVVELKEIPFEDVVCSSYSFFIPPYLLKIIDLDQFIIDMMDHFKVNLGVREIKKLVYSKKASNVILYCYEKMLGVSKEDKIIKEFLKSVVSGEKALIMSRLEQILVSFSISQVYYALLDFLVKSEDIKTKYGLDGRNRLLLYLGTGVDHLEYRILSIIFNIL